MQHFNKFSAFILKFLSRITTASSCKDTSFGAGISMDLQQHQHNERNPKEVAKPKWAIIFFVVRYAVVVVPAAVVALLIAIIKHVVEPNVM